MQKGTIEIFKTDKGTDIQVVLENDTIWLNQEQIALVFGTKRPAITKHIKNIFESGELQEHMVSSKMELTTSSFNSAVSKIFFRCLVTAGLCTPNKSAIFC